MYFRIIDAIGEFGKFCRWNEKAGMPCLLGHARFDDVS